MLVSHEQWHFFCYPISKCRPREAPRVMAAVCVCGGSLCIYKHIVFDHICSLKKVHKLIYLSLIVKYFHVFNDQIELMELQWHSPSER